jgi:DNA-binding SARP family transcriptional activator/TolB-like protein
LALLSTTLEKRLTRERVMASLWPDATPDSARRSLSESLYALRQVLGDAAIVSNGEELLLDPTILPSDLDSIEVAIAAGDADRAVREYVGPFLDGWFVDDAAPFEQWTESQRARIHSKIVELVRAEAETRVGRRDLQGSVALWRAAVRLEPHSSPMAAQLARVLGQLGERAEGLRILADHRARIAKDLEIEPDAEIGVVEGQLRSTVAAKAARSTISEGPAVHADSAPAPPALEHAEAPVAQRPRILYMMAALGLFGIVAAAAAWLAAPQKELGNVSAGRSIAILTLAHGRGDSAMRQVAEDLTRGLVDQLSVNTFTVVPLEEIRAVGSDRRALDSLIAERKVGAIIEGSITALDDEQLRATVRVINAETRDQLAATTYLRPLNEAVALETDVVEFAASTLRKFFRESVLLRDASRGARDPEARKLVVTALRLEDDAITMAASRKRFDAEAATDLLVSADTLLQQAAAAEPSWTQPLIARGRLFRLRALLSKRDASPALLDSALQWSDAALRLDPRDAAAWELRGMARWGIALSQRRPDHDTLALILADKDIRKAVELEHTRAEAWLTWSFIQTARGQATAALVSAKRARTENAFVADPFDTHFAEFTSAMAAGNVRDASRWCAAGRAAYPNEARFVECALTVLRESPATSDSAVRAWQYVALLDSMDKTRPRREGETYAPILRRMMAAAVSARSGDTALANSELRAAHMKAAGDRRTQLDLSFDEAYLLLVLRDTSTAVRLLRELQRERPLLRRIIVSAPLFEAIRDSVNLGRQLN